MTGTNTGQATIDYYRTAPATCPKCGYCPHCGRSTTMPWYPCYPPYYVTCSNTTVPYTLTTAAGMGAASAQSNYL